jgi:hypothetical protein
MSFEEFSRKCAEGTLMDVRSFASELLRALATVEAIERVALQSEGPVVKGRAYATTELFLGKRSRGESETRFFSTCHTECA